MKIQVKISWVGQSTNSHLTHILQDIHAMLTASTTSMKSKAMTESPIHWLGNNQYATFYLGQIENCITALLSFPLFVLWLNIDFSLNAPKRWGRTGSGRASIEIGIEMKIGISKSNENWNCADIKIRLGGEGVRPRRAPRDNLTNCPGPLSSLPQQRNYKSQELSFSLPEAVMPFILEIKRFW